MHHIADQETEPQITDPATLDAKSQEEAGWYYAATLPQKVRDAKYRKWHRVSQHPFSRGFRRFVVRSH